MQRGGAAFEAVERPRPPAEKVDFSDYAYDAPWKVEDEADDESESDLDEQSTTANTYDDFYDDEVVEDQLDDDDLFAALDQALDEIEEEQRIETVRAIAAPEHDALEVTPAPQTIYRDHLRELLGRHTQVRAPRYTEVCVRVPVANADFSSLLEDGLRRARLSREQRRAVGKIKNPELRSALTY